MSHKQQTTVFNFDGNQDHGPADTNVCNGILLTTVE